MPVKAGCVLLALWLLIGADPARAFDCARAGTDVEQLICAAPGLKSLDDALGAAYQSVRDQTPKNGRAALSAAQRAWIAEREACSSAEDPTACVQSSTQTRTAQLQGAALAGPGLPGRIIPLFYWQDGTDAIYAIDVTLLRVTDPATPGEARLNRLAEHLAAEIPFGPHGDEPNPYYDYILQEGLDYLSPRFASVSIPVSSYTGGAHPNHGISHVNVDMATGRDLAAANLFAPATQDDLTQSCRDQIIAEKTRRLAADGQSYIPAEDAFLSDEVLGDHVADLSRWSFTDREALIDFDPYSIGAYAEGDFACRFDLKDLRAMALPGALLP